MSLFEPLLVQCSCVLELFAMSHWKVEDFVAELVHFAEIQKRKPDSQLIQGLWKSLEGRLRAVQTWRAPDILQLLDKVEELQLPETWSLQVSQTVESLCLQENSHMKLTAGAQTVETLAPYLSTQDWEKIQSSKTVVDCMAVLVVRLKKMGIVHMREDTKKQCMAIVMWWMGDNIPAAWPLYYLCQDFSRLFAADDTRCLIESLARYPSNPTTLTEGWLQKVYGSDEAPAVKDLNLGAFLSRIPLRSTSSLLTRKSSGVSGQVSEQTQESTSSSPWDAVGQALATFMNRWDSNKEEKEVVPADLKPKPARVATPQRQLVPLCDMVPPEQNLVPPEPAATSRKADHTKPSLEDFEQQAMSQLQEKKSKGKKTQPAVFKRPSARTVRTASKKWSPSKGHGCKVWGCIRCRGNPKGCSTCQDPARCIVRFQGRHQWNQWNEEKQTGRK